MNSNNDNTLAGNNAEEIRKRYAQKKRQAAVNNQMLNEYNYLRSKEDSKDGLYNTCHSVMASQGKKGLFDLVRIAQSMLAHIDHGSTL